MTARCVLIYLFVVLLRSRIFHLYGDVDISGYGTQTIEVHVCTMPIRLWWGEIFILLHLLIWHGTSIFWLSTVPFSPSGRTYLTPYTNGIFRVETYIKPCLRLWPFPYTNAIRISHSLRKKAFFKNELRTTKGHQMNANILSDYDLYK